MLTPHDRTSLFEALRPPAGYALDAAVGTSFTLDLEALLTAPLAFAMFEVEQTDDGQEPVGLLEAVRRHARRITVFSQAGQIAVPNRPRTIFAWLESVVVEVTPPRGGRLFHPKIWVIRYRHSDGSHAALKVLCGTRNLTFDTTWDTLLVLESRPYETLPDKTRSETSALADALHILPSLATRPLPRQRAEMVESLATDLSRVSLLPPEPFDAVRLHVLGLNDGDDPLPDRSLQALVISPFLGNEALAGLADRHHIAALISRPESLDRIDPAVLTKVQRTAVLNPVAEVSAPDQTGRAESPTEDRDPAVVLTGLHAKLYVFDTKDGTRLFTGSANATSAAFNGNVEVLAELHGPEEVGVDSLLADSGRETGFDKLLMDYDPLDQPVEPSDEELLQRSVDTLRHALAALTFTAQITADGDTYRLTLTTDNPLPTLDADQLTLTAWPATLTEQLSARVLPIGEPASLAFPVSFEGITTFFAIRITARRGTSETTSAFVVTAQLLGAPTDRHSRLLAGMLRDPDRLLGYLVMLLGDTDRWGLGASDQTAANWRNRYGGSWNDVPVMEYLVRAVDRYPSRLEHFQGVMRDLGEHRDSVLPEGLIELWNAVWAAREERP